MTTTIILMVITVIDGHGYDRINYHGGDGIMISLKYISRHDKLNL